MARDAVAITALATNAGTDEAAGTAINVGNGAYIAAGGDMDRLLVVVKNTAGAEYDATFAAGVGPRKDLGNLVVPVAATTGVEFVVLESARFAQSDGNINIDFEASMTGTVAAYRLPKG